MDLMCPQHNEPLIALDKALRPMPVVPANAQDVSAELGKAYCERCNDWYFYAYNASEPYLVG